MRGLSRFINAVSRCTEPIAPRVVPYFTDASLLLPAWAIRPVLFSAPASRRWRIKPTSTACSAGWRRQNSYGDLIRDWMA